MKIILTCATLLLASSISLAQAPAAPDADSSASTVSAPTLPSSEPVVASTDDSKSNCSNFREREENLGRQRISFSRNRLSQGDYEHALNRLKEEFPNCVKQSIHKHQHRGQQHDRQPSNHNQNRHRR